MRARRAAAPLLILGLVLAACSSTGGAASSAAPSTAPSAAAASPSAAASAAATGAAVDLADSSLGKIIVDGKGMTLYVFTPDTGGTSACTGDCAKSWPPLTSDAAPTIGTGLDAGDFAVIKRDDGTSQVTFYGKPLYYFAGDKAAGDVNGQGLNSKWYVVDGDGKMVGAAAASPSAAASAASSAAATGTAVNLADSSLGKIVVDGKGMTLYAFTADSAGKSVCNGDCATSWPPLTSDAAPTLGTGLDAEDFALIKRDDGTSQVTFYGMPLYLFAGDKAAGDVNGQGLNSKWYVVDGDGKLVK